jgi:hypothetical protein
MPKGSARIRRIRGPAPRGLVEIRWWYAELTGAQPTFDLYQSLRSWTEIEASAASIRSVTSDAAHLAVRQAR